MKQAKGIYDHYFKYDEITTTLKQYAQEYPEYCRLSSIGTTPENREIWLIEITDPSTGTYEDKPGFAVTANIHAGEVTGNCCAMYFLDTIFANLNEEPVASLLKKNTVYCIPRISPDGSELYLTTTTMLRSVPRYYPFEQPMPGLQPEDLDGDGVIRQMRVKNPNGAFKINPDEPRMMIKRLPDDLEGDFYDVYSEGTILEYDPDEEITSAPALFGNDLNRNFPISWAPENRQRGAGSYALSNMEAASMAKFLEAHKNLCTVLHFHTMGGQYLYPPGYKSGKQAEQDDMQLYKAIGRMATEETGYVCWNVRDDYMGNRDGEILGLMDDFCYFAMGLINYTCETWDLDVRAGTPHVSPRKDPTDEELIDQVAKRLKWIDEHNDGIGFKNWTKFDHPQLGEVEIGGFDYKNVIQNAPSKYIPQEVEKHTRFLLREMKTLPHLYFKNTKVTPLGGTHFKIETTIANSAYLPTYVTKEALKVGRAQEITAELCGASVTEGKAKQKIGHLNGFWSKAAYGWGLGGTTVKHAPAEKKLSWIVEGASGDTVTITCQCPRAGKAVETITL
ncbi:MAG: M14 family metallopeptidase [Erysipelotrichaceae bacterium]|nr:M14 family metallopeptidase [Erysipelotrichaceae bacterium]